jgi:hypothetical protein
MEDSPELPEPPSPVNGERDREESEEDHGDTLNGMEAPGCTSIEQGQFYGRAGGQLEVGGEASKLLTGNVQIGETRQRDCNNNTFTWSGHSGVLAAPDNGPWVIDMVVQAKTLCGTTGGTVALCH